LVAMGQAIPDSLATSYRDRDIKLLLQKETADKCAYCESKITHVDYGDVEHIIPKVKRPDLRFDYSNLTYACSVCNTKKGDYHDDAAPLLNPYIDAPEEHLLAVGPMLMRLPTSDKGLVTQKRLDLNRAPLIERRTERLESIGTLMDQVARANSTAVRQVLLDQIGQESADDKEYAFIVQGFVNCTLRFIDPNVN